MLKIWAEGLKELSNMETDVSQYVLRKDMVLLQGQVEELHSQWEELYLKDCIEEINLFSKNKSHLKQLGVKLLLSNDKAKEAEIHRTLCEVSDHWQHLFDHIEARVNRLTEALITVHQLNKNMNNLCSWLTHIEAELAKPVHYDVCHKDGIQKRLTEQQDLKPAIEQHTECLASVSTLCHVLVHNEDACSSNGENDSIKQTTHSLDRHWRNICSMSLDRKLQIEKTWRLWCTFQEDYHSFEGWLNVAEKTAAEPNSSDVPYTEAKKELKKYEALQKHVHDSLTQLEIINNQYRRLARENRSNAASRIRAMVHQGNERWVALQRRVAAILRRLRHFTSQREEFEGTRRSLLIWLTEIDLQLSTVEHLSEHDLQEKMKYLKSFKKEISLNTNRIDVLIVFGEGLIQRTCPHDAVVIEDELEELHLYCQEVFRRVGRFHQHLTSLLLEQPEVLDRERSGDTQSTSCEMPTYSQPSMCLLAPTQERSGCETPVIVDCIPLEWDHTGDVGCSSSHHGDEDTASSSLTAQNWSFQNIPERKSFNLETSAPSHTSTPYKKGYVPLISKCSGSIKSAKMVSMILDDEEQQEEHRLTVFTTADKQSEVMECWELKQAKAVIKEQCSTRHFLWLTSDLHDITSWLEHVIPELDKLQKPESSASVEMLEERVKEFQEYHEMVRSIQLWLVHAESRCYTVNMDNPSMLSKRSSLEEHRNTLKVLEKELRARQKPVGSLKEMASVLLPEAGGKDNAEAREKLQLLSNQINHNLQIIQERIQSTTDATEYKESSECSRSATRETSPQRSFFYWVLRAAMLLHILFLLLACLVPHPEDDYSCTLSNNFAISFHPMLLYTNGPPPT